MFSELSPIRIENIACGSAIWSAIRRTAGFPSFPLLAPMDLQRPKICLPLFSFMETLVKHRYKPLFEEQQTFRTISADLMVESVKHFCFVKRIFASGIAWVSALSNRKDGTLVRENHVSPLPDYPTLRWSAYLGYLLKPLHNLLKKPVCGLFFQFFKIPCHKSKKRFVNHITAGENSAAYLCAALRLLLTVAFQDESRSSGEQNAQFQQLSPVCHSAFETGPQTTFGTEGGFH